ncbi:MAG: carbamoyltransferase [Phycisphaerales bacterium]|nr:carbamoyltransferase [Phycisphaerales bacterium]
MKRLVLGLNSAHPDAAAVLADERGIVAAIAEERINRIKHCAVYPRQAIEEVLRIAGASISDVTDVAVARDPRANLRSKLAFIARNPRVGLNLAKVRLGVQKGAKTVAAVAAEELGVRQALIKAQQHNVEHHLAHIASAFYCSGFDQATGVSVDGSGDWCSVMIARCRGNSIEVLHRTHPPHSLGIFYSTMCIFMGFNKFGEEYKVMGLAAYGNDVYAEQMKKLVKWDPKRGVVLNREYFTAYAKVFSEDERHFKTTADSGEIIMPDMHSPKMADLFGPPRKRGTPLTERENNLAASIQAQFERVYLEMLQDAMARCGSRNLVMAGGCALNGVGNGKLVMQGLCDRIYIHPAAADDGTAAGAALQVLHGVHKAPRTGQVDSAYFGTGWTDDQIARDAQEASARLGLKFTRLSRQDLLNTAVDALCQGRIMGWFQGREEWGPRALGNRSIICNPSWPDMKAILNARIKNREAFRPFAPAILFERLTDVYDGSAEVPFMNIVYTTKPAWRQRLSAVTHEDQTGRVQTVKRSQNDLYYDLIKTFGDRTGVPVLLNTSFNENEPIVHTPAQAIACFARTKMDCLGIGSFWVEKPRELADKAQIIGEN